MARSACSATQRNRATRVRISFATRKQALSTNAVPFGQTLSVVVVVVCKAAQSLTLSAVLWCRRQRHGDRMGAVRSVRRGVPPCDNGLHLPSQAPGARVCPAIPRFWLVSFPKTLLSMFITKRKDARTHTRTHASTHPRTCTNARARAHAGTRGHTHGRVWSAVLRLQKRLGVPAVVERFGFLYDGFKESRVMFAGMRFVQVCPRCASVHAYASCLTSSCLMCVRVASVPTFLRVRFVLYLCVAISRGCRCCSWRWPLPCAPTSVDLVPHACRCDRVWFGEQLCAAACASLRSVPLCVCVCVCVCARARVCVCVCARARVDLSKPAFSG